MYFLMQLYQHGFKIAINKSAFKTRGKDYLTLRKLNKLLPFYIPELSVLSKNS